MNIRDNQVLVAKQQVCQALGDNYKTYLANMKLWFRKIWTKEQFDAECRKLFTSKQRHLHNQFFLAILNKITAPMHPKTATINITKHSDLSKSRAATAVARSVSVHQPEQNGPNSTRLNCMMCCLTRAKII